MIKIAVNGAAGRMGTRILALADASKEYSVAGAFDENGSGRVSAEALSKKGKGVLIDFSSPDGTLLALEAASGAGWGLVVGTTGLGGKVQRALSEARREIPIVYSANMSVGINLVLELLKLVSSKLPKGFAVKITEAHHVHKKDAPSGTALMLSAAAQKAMRSRQKIDIQSIREGEIVGDHTVLFSGPAETIEITHRAQSRDAFARGALLAARFAASAKPGLYSMADVLA